MTAAVSTPSAASSYYIPPNAGGGTSQVYTPPAPNGSGYGASPTYSYQTQVVTYATQPPSQRTVYHQTRSTSPGAFQTTGLGTEVVATPTPIGSMYTVPASVSPSAAYTPSTTPVYTYVSSGPYGTAYSPSGATGPSPAHDPTYRSI